MIIFAPAKINLFLHVTGKRDDGYHDLQSLVCFADIGDEIQIEPSDHFKFSITGAFADRLSDDESNLVVQAARWIAEQTGRTLKCHITLTKKLPVAAGIGGGSSDAAAVIRGLLKIWDMEDWLENIAPGTRVIGTDVPVCMMNRSTFIEGTGEVLSGVDLPKNIRAVLVNPLIPCSTENVFGNFDRAFSPLIERPERFENYNDLCVSLSHQRNDLEQCAVQVVPEISQILDFLNGTNADIVRLSGSGATCFGLFKTQEDAVAARETIQAEHPQWWVQAARLNPTLSTNSQ